MYENFNFISHNLSDIQKSEAQNIARLISTISFNNQERLFYIVCCAVFNDVSHFLDN